MKYTLQKYYGVLLYTDYVYYIEFATDCLSIVFRNEASG